MRFLAAFMAMLVAAVATAELRAQDAPRVESARVGFPSYRKDEGGRYKVGLWAPVALTVEAGTSGLSGRVLVETPDSEDVGTILPAPLRLAGREKQVVQTYAKAGNLSGHFTIKVEGGGETASETASEVVQAEPLPLGGRLYLTAGARLEDFESALAALTPPGLASAGGPRFAALADEVEALPARWLGYEAVDLLILSTHKGAFVRGLAGDADRVKALARWVRSGGRLVVMVDPAEQKAVSELLGATDQERALWDPPLPLALPPTPRPAKIKDGEDSDLPERLFRVESWADVQDKALKARRTALADLGDVSATPCEVLADSIVDHRPLVVRFPYGRGSITLLAFDLNRPPFSTWGGRKAFLAGMVKALEPPVVHVAAAEAQGWDLATQLQRTLDNFDVPVVSFGWVAVLILVYILIVGPLDYLVLGRLMGRLEWTWITFPVAVVAGSALIVWASGALKGKELRINKIDVVDFDLRTGAGSGSRTPRAHAYGQTWFALLSPRVDTYTIGVEPALHQWGLCSEGRGSRSVALSWLGRPEFDGPGSYGRARASFLRRGYEFAPEAAGLVQVPIPVATSKAFTASWEAVLDELPFDADFIYHPGNRTMRVSGTLTSRLPVDLTDVWLLHGGRGYEVGRLPGGRRETVKVSLTLERERPLQNWSARDSAGEDVPAGRYDPTTLIKEILFQEKVDIGANHRNHALRHLDLSWRLKEDEQGSLQEVILFGRVERRSGPTRDLEAADIASPTALRIRPPLEGVLTQDTYIRAILPTRLK